MADAADFTCCDSGHHLPVLPRRGTVYYLASVLIILYTMVPFFPGFRASQTPGEGTGGVGGPVCHCRRVPGGV